MFELVWSDHLLAEVERILTERKGLTEAQSAYFVGCIRDAFPEGLIATAEYLPLVATRRGPDPGDHAHSAAAVAGRATIVLSADRRGFPPDDIAPARRRHPDAYLTGLLRRYPADVLGIVDAMGASLRVPLARPQVLRRLAAAGIPAFAALAETL